MSNVYAISIPFTLFRGTPDKKKWERGPDDTFQLFLEAESDQDAVRLIKARIADLFKEDLKIVA